MAALFQNGLEILVHVSAPSKGKDDARYRDLASAYLTFDPLTRKSSSQETSIDFPEVLNQGAERQLQDELKNSRQEQERVSGKPIFDEGDESYLEVQSQTQASLRKNYLTRSHLKEIPRLKGSLQSPQASFDSVQDNNDSPGLKRQMPVVRFNSNIDASLDKENEESWAPPPSEVAETQSVCGRPIPEFSSPTRVLELFLQQFPSAGVEMKSATDGSSRVKKDLNERMAAPSQERTSTAENWTSQADSTKSFSSGPLYEESSFAIPSSPPIFLPTIPSGSSQLEEHTSQLLSDSSPSPTHSKSERLYQEKCHLPHIIDITTSYKDMISEQETSQTREFSRSSLLAGTSSLPIPSRSRSLCRDSNQVLADEYLLRGKELAESKDLPTSSLPTSIAKLHVQFELQRPPRLITPFQPISNDLNLQKRTLSTTAVKSSVSARTAGHPALSKETVLSSKGTKSLLPQKRKQPSSDASSHSAFIPSTQIAIPSQAASKSSIDYLSLNTIHPPPPKSNTTTINTLLTPDLSELATRLNLADRYKPKSQSRELRKMERGYWLVNTETWGEELAAEAWRNLGSYIADSRAGWGVWCTKETGGEFKKIERMNGDTEGGRQRGEGEEGVGVSGTRKGRRNSAEKWRIYCWGEVVAYVWLVVYLVSGRRVKAAGSRWVDGAGDIVIVMECGK